MLTSRLVQLQIPSSEGVLLCQQALGPLRCLSSDRRCDVQLLDSLDFSKYLDQCDTFSRSSDAVFELSTRFAEPFKQLDGISDDEKTDAGRLMFLELTQGTLLSKERTRKRDTGYNYSVFMG